jgi:hypothetical protein
MQSSTDMCKAQDKMRTLSIVGTLRQIVFVGDHDGRSSSRVLQSVERRKPPIPGVRHENEIDTVDSMLIEIRGGKLVRRQKLPQLLDM